MNLRNELVEILINRDCASHYTFACRNGLGLLIFRSLTGYYHTKYSFDATNICIFLEIWAKSPKKIRKNDNYSQNNSYLCNVRHEFRQ